MPRWLCRRFARRRLRDPHYAFLLEEDDGVERVSLDCETTGLDPRTAEILSIGAVKIRGRRILASDKLELYVRPSGAIDVESIKIHRLRHVDLEHGIPTREAIGRLLHFIGARALVGYYLEFDVALVNRYLRPWLGISLCNHQIEVSGLYHDRMIGAIPTRQLDLRFDTILRGLGLPSLGQHDAVNDALMTAMIYVKLTASTHS